MPIVFGDESASVFFLSEHPVVPSELLEGPQPSSFGLFGVARSCLMHTLRERHFLFGCLMIDDHHFHPTTTATASAIPAAVPPTTAGMEIAAAWSVLVVGVAVLEFVEIVTLPIMLEVRWIATLTLPVSEGMAKETEDCYQMTIPSLYTP